MPNYDYICHKCKTTTTIHRSIHAKDTTPPNCQECYEPTTQLFSPAPTHFKSEGFYKTDNRKDK